MDSMVRIHRLSKSYGSIKAVESISFEVNRGELFGLIGPDGAGKTTTMRAIVSLVIPDSGEITVDSKNVTTEAATVRRITGYMPQRFSLYKDLSIRENLKFYAELFGVPKKEIPVRLNRLYAFSRLEQFAGRLAGQLSGGMKQKLALSCTLVHEPVLLVLDEPTTGVDPVSRNEFWAILSELKSGGVTILISTPYMEEAMNCDRIAIMHNGKILAAGDPGSFPEMYRKHLYAVHDHELYTHVDRMRALPNVESVHAFGDSLHISVSPEVSSKELEETLSVICERPVTLTRIQPSLENVFIELIREEQSNDR